MVVRKPVEMLPTMKVSKKKLKDGDILAKECQVTILDIKDVKSEEFGNKVCAVVENEELGKFNVFLNNFSIEQLNKAYGEDDENWKGQIVDLKVEEDPTFKNDMIVTRPVK